MNTFGKVYIAGAGPGDPELITIKTFELLKSCDVILFDKLANPELLNSAKDDAEKIFVGKSAGTHFVKQEETIGLLIKNAKDGKSVLRLKGGDPFIFGRGSEEAIALRNEGIEFEIIPGITAGAAATAYSGIPLTHRNMVEQTVFITAHESPGKAESQIEWERLAQMKNTNLVIYMGVGMIPQIVETLLNNGMDKNTPSAFIENGTMPTQRCIRGVLSDMPILMISAAIKAPVIFIIGPTVSLREDLKWFENKPLYGKRIVAARSDGFSSSLYSKLYSLGAQVIPFKVIKTIYSKPEIDLKNLFKLPTKYDWLIFSSENGVKYFFRALGANGLDSRCLAGIRIAVIGSGTENKLNEYFLNADLIPAKFTSESLIEIFRNQLLNETNKLNFLRIKGDFKNDHLTDSLRDLGANVETMEVYKLIQDTPEDGVKSDLLKSGADAVMFTSVSTVNNFFNVLGDENAKQILNNSSVVAIGPVTAKALINRDINIFIESEVQTIEGMIECLINIFK